MDLVHPDQIVPAVIRATDDDAAVPAQRVGRFEEMLGGEQGDVGPDENRRRVSADLDQVTQCSEHPRAEIAAALRDERHRAGRERRDLVAAVMGRVKHERIDAAEPAHDIECVGQQCSAQRGQTRFSDMGDETRLAARRGRAGEDRDGGASMTLG